MVLLVPIICEFSDSSTRWRVPKDHLEGRRSHKLRSALFAFPAIRQARNNVVGKVMIDAEGLGNRKAQTIPPPCVINLGGLHANVARFF